jgi:hypothetical protein
MISPPPAHDDHPDTPLAAQRDLLIILPTATTPAASSVEDLPNSSLPSSTPSIPSGEAQTTHLLRPIPTPSVNASQASFSFSDATGSSSDGGALFDPLSPEIASADISIARE